MCRFFQRQAGCARLCQIGGIDVGLYLSTGRQHHSVSEIEPVDCPVLLAFVSHAQTDWLSECSEHVEMKKDGQQVRLARYVLLENNGLFDRERRRRVRE